MQTERRGEKENNEISSRQRMSGSLIELMPADVVLDVFCCFLSVFDLRALSQVSRRYRDLFSSQRAWSWLKRRILAAYPSWDKIVFQPEKSTQEVLKEYMFPLLTVEGLQSLCSKTRTEAQSKSFSSSYFVTRAIFGVLRAKPFRRQCWFSCGICKRSKTLKLVAVRNTWESFVWHPIAFLRKPYAIEIKPFQDKLKAILL